MSNDGRAAEWVSFEDDAGETWLFELAFFRSNWECIYGDGCAGIEEHPDPARHRGCCSYGAHFADEADLQRVMAVALALPADLWQRRPAELDTATQVDETTELLTTVDDDGARITRVVEDACVFLNDPDFEAGPGCALHIAADRSEIEALEWKPEVCWQLPIRVEHHLDENDHSTHLVRQWTRRDWGDAGADLGWWCAEAEEAYRGQASVARYLRSEIAALAGQRIADALIDHVEGRSTVVLLPRPAVRRD